MFLKFISRYFRGYSPFFSKFSIEKFWIDSEELDRIITDDEILVAISNLNRSKSHGIDGLLNEYFIEYKDLLLPLLNKLL
jgi:hypothetical protein